jgi:hypothetical protein
MSDINDEVHAVAEHLRRLNMEFDRYGNLTAQSADAIRKKTSAENYRDQMLAQSGQAAAQGLQSLYKAASTYTSAMYEGQRGSAALNSTITQVTSGLGNLATALAFLVTPGGPLKKILVAAITQLGAKTLEVATEMDNASRNMVSKQMDAYEQLSRTGAVAGEGLTGLGEGAARVGVSIFKMDKYLSLIGGNSGTLAQFGNGVFDGRRKFEALGKAMEGERARFKLLGMDQDELNEGMMGYIRMLNLTGRAQTMTTDQLRDGVKKYLVEQDALTKITGASRKEAEDIKAQAMMDERFNATISVMEAQGGEQAEQAKNLQNAIVQLTKMGATDAVQAIKAQGDISAPGVAQFANAMQGKYFEILDLLKTDVPAAMKMIGEQAEKTTILTQGGTGPGAKGLAQFGASEQVYGSRYQNQQLAQLAKKSMAEVAAAAKTEQDKQLGQGKDEKGNIRTAPTDPRLQREVELLEVQQKTNILLQRLINEGYNTLLGPGGADASQMTALNVAKTELDFVREQVKARNPKLLESEKQVNSMTLPEAQAGEAITKRYQEKAFEVLSQAAAGLKTAQTEYSEAKNALNLATKSGTAADIRAAQNELDQIQRKVKVLEIEKANAEKEHADAYKRHKQAEEDLAKVKKTAQDVAPKETEKTKENVHPAGETDLEKQARIKKEAEAAEKAKTDAKTAAEEKAKKDAEDKSKANETAKITLLPNGARVLDDVLELVKQGVPVVSNVRTQEEQDKLKDHQDEKGNWFTKNNLPVAEDSKHLTGDAIDVRTKDMTEDLEKLLKESGWMRPLPKSDPGHWQRAPKPKEKKTSEVGPNDVNLATALSKNFDLSDTTAGLTINSDVATLNSKGMSVSLDNSADVAKMIAEPVIEQVSASQKDQSAARASFESTFGDLRAEMAKQKATDDLLLAAVQELIRVQKTGVEVQQKIYQATA